MIQIKRLDWDSDFFQFEIGQIINDPNLLGHMTDFKSFGYKLLIGRCSEVESDFIKFFEQQDGVLVDTKVVFKIDIVKLDTGDTTSIQFFDCNQSKDELVSLAFQSGEYSRFKLDPNFNNNEFENLYTEWVNKSIKEDGIKVAIYKVKNNINGFITFEFKSGFAEIGLFAVDINIRREGIGKKLINFVFKECLLNGINKLYVSTQELNSKACAFYENNGFEIESKEKIYHFWKLKNRL